MPPPLPASTSKQACTQGPCTRECSYLRSRSNRGRRRYTPPWAQSRIRPPQSHRQAGAPRPRSRRLRKIRYQCFSRHCSLPYVSKRRSHKESVRLGAHSNTSASFRFPPFSDPRPSHGFAPRARGPFCRQLPQIEPTLSHIREHAGSNSRHRNSRDKRQLPAHRQPTR